MPAPVVGMAVPIETRVELEPGRRTAGTVRLWLLSPEGQRRVVEGLTMVEPGLYRAAPILTTPGIWEWQFEAVAADGSKRVLHHGRVRVRASGFDR